MGETLRNSGRCKRNSQEIGEKVRDNHLSLRNSGRFKENSQEIGEKVRLSERG